MSTTAADNTRLSEENRSYITSKPFHLSLLVEVHNRVQPDTADVGVNILETINDLQQKKSLTHKDRLKYTPQFSASCDLEQENRQPLAFRPRSSSLSPKSSTSTCSGIPFIDDDHQQPKPSYLPNNTTANIITFNDRVLTKQEKIEKDAQSETIFSPIPDICRESYLNYKIISSDGKRYRGRTWKTVWAVLRGHLLYLLKEKKHFSVMTPLSMEEQPISIKYCLVDIANNYTKRRNVLSLRTFNESEYLLQADDSRNMAEWIKAIQINSDPDNDKDGVLISDLISRTTTSLDTRIGLLRKSPLAKPIPRKPSFLIKSKFSIGTNLKRRASFARYAKFRNKLKSKALMRTRSKSYCTKREECIPCKEFGVNLEDCLPSPYNKFVPLVVTLCTKVVEMIGLDVVGIYRVPGNSVAVNSLIRQFNLDMESITDGSEKWFDVHVISSLLRCFLRKLPRAVIPEDRYNDFISASRLKDRCERMKSLKKLVCDLPEYHFETLSHLCSHLFKVACHSQINKMRVRNLAIVFGPTLLRPLDCSVSVLVVDTTDQCLIIESFILNHEWFFNLHDDLECVPDDTISEDSVFTMGESFDKLSVKNFTACLISDAKRLSKNSTSDTFSSVDSLSRESAEPIEGNCRLSKYVSTYWSDSCLLRSMDSLDSSINYDQRRTDRFSSTEISDRKQIIDNEHENHQSSELSLFDEQLTEITSNDTQISLQLKNNSSLKCDSLEENIQGFITETESDIHALPDLDEMANYFTSLTKFYDDVARNLRDNSDLQHDQLSGVPDRFVENHRQISPVSHFSPQSQYLDAFDNLSLFANPSLHKNVDNKTK